MLCTLSAAVVTAEFYHNDISFPLGTLTGCQGLSHGCLFQYPHPYISSCPSGSPSHSGLQISNRLQLSYSISFVAGEILLHPFRAMDPKWFPVPNRPVRASGIVFVPFLAICNISLLLPPGRPRVLLTLPPLAYLLWQVPSTTSGNIAEDYMLAINVSQFAYRYVTSVLFASPESDMYRVVVSGEKKGMREPEDALSMGLW